MTENDVGIYCIQNNITGKRYIGQSHNIKCRFKQHKIQEHNKHLLRSFNFYGIENFTFDVLYRVNPQKFSTEQSLQSRLDDLEMAYIDILETYLPSKGYNKTYGGEGQRCTDEIRKKLSEAMLGSKNHRYGTTPSAETSRKLSLARLGRKRSKETAYKISLSRKDRRAVYCVNNNHIYPSLIECSRILNIDYRHIPAVCRGEQSTVKGYVFYYAEDIDITQWNMQKRKECLSMRCPPKVYCSTNNTEYLSVTNAARALKIGKGNISHVCLGHRKRAGGYVFSYIPNYIWED